MEHAREWLMLLITLAVSPGWSSLFAAPDAARQEGLLVYIENGQTSRFRVGQVVMVQLVADGPFRSTSKATVRITSAATGYDSGIQPLAFSADGRSLYYRWPTWRLTPAGDYRIAASVQDEQGTRSYSLEVTLYPHMTETHRLLASGTDLFQHYMGMGLQFARQFRYDSSVRVPNGVLGYGWAHGHAVRIEEGTDGSVTFFDVDGSARYYRSLSGGVYQSMPGDRARLTRDPDGSFQLRLPGGSLWRFRSDLRLESFQDRNGNRVRNIYGPNGRLVGISTPNSAQNIALNYDGAGRIVSSADLENRTVYYSCTSGGELASIADILGNVTGYSYDDQHRLVQVNLPDGSQQFFSYDTDGRLGQVSRSDGFNALTFTYDEKTGAETITDALGRATTITTNEADLITEVRENTGNTTRFTYDRNLNLTSITDPNGHGWQIGYDGQGNPISIAAPDGSVTSLSFSPDLSQVTGLVDAKQNQTSFAYSASGDLARIVYPDGATESSDISDDGGTRVVQRRRRDGRTVKYAYDPRGLLTAKSFPDGSQWTYQYDTRGNLTSASNQAGTIYFEYDKLSRLMRTTYPGGRRFVYEYDAMGRRAKMTDPDGRLLVYSYNKAGYLTAITCPAEGTIVEYVYNLAGQVVKRRRGNQTYAEYEYYDPAGRVSSVTDRNGSGWVISRWNYQYDPAGNRVRKSGPDGEESYSFDTTGQLIGVTYPNAVQEQFSYDPNGNRRVVVTQDGRGSAATVYTTNALNRYTELTGAKLGSDLNGNLSLVNMGGQLATYEHDAEGRLTLARLPSGETIAYGYDALGRLASRTDKNGTAHFLWDGDQIAIEENDAHFTLARYTWGRALNDVLAMRRGGKDYFYLHDALLSTTELTDPNGNVVERYRYRAFGQPSNISQFGNPFLFTGSYYDSVLGLGYNRARWYSSWLGRFLEPSPLGLAGGINAYSYVFNNPVSSFDPYGLGGSGVKGATALPGAGLVGLPGAISIGPGLLGSIGRLVGQSQCRSITATGVLDSVLGAGMGQPAETLPPCTSSETAISGPSIGGGGMCPTFIQVAPDATDASRPSPVIDVTREKLAARLTVPVNGALVRADVPVFGVAGGTDFKEYRVEFGEGPNPKEWRLIARSEQPQQSCGIGLADVPHMQGDIDIRGNLATWNTGLKEWVHLPWHPASDPTDLNGVYTLRLVVIGKDGRRLEDRVVVEVGGVVAQALPGLVSSADRKVTLSFPQHALQAPFRVYSITPVLRGAPPLPAGQELVGAVYAVREPGDKFMKPVTLRFDVNGGLGPRKLDHCGLFRFDSERAEWVPLPTAQGAGKNTLEASIQGLPAKAAYFAVLAAKSGQEQSRAAAPPAKTAPPPGSNDAILVFEDFEKDTGEWAGRDGDFGATVSRDRSATPDGTYCLKVTNRNFGGTFGVTVHSTPFQADVYPLVGFDYKIGPGVKTDFYVRVGKTWYNIGFTDDENDWRHRDTGIARIGRIEGVAADGQWHSATLDLDKMLARKTARRRVEEIMMGDWDVTGYMKLDFGRNPRNATFYIDNFKIRRGSEHPLAGGKRELWVDDLETPRSTNMLGGAFDVFTNPGAYNCIMARVPSGEAASGNGYALSLKYDVTRSGAYAGLWSELQRVSVEKFDTLALRVKVVSGPGHFSVGLKNAKGAEVRVPVAGYLGSANAAGWRTLAIPLAAYAELAEFSSLSVFSISFSETARSGKGEILVDDIRFQKGVEYILVDDFQSVDLESNRLEHRNWTFSRGAAAVSAGIMTNRAPGAAKPSLRVSYGGSIGLDLGGGDFSYAGWAAALGGVDASRTRYLRFRIKGQAGGERTNVYLDDGVTRKFVDLAKYSLVTTEWREVAVPLDDYARQGIDVTHLEALEFVFEWEQMSGTIYLQDVCFGGRVGEAVSGSPLQVTAAKPNGRAGQR